jgi:uncharacterized membrane protein
MADRYKKRLEKDLDRWIAAGLVPNANRDAILNAIAPPPARWSAQGAAAILGAVLLALAALSFVAANWSELSRLSRFVVILTALSAAYGAAGIAFARNNTALGHALALLGAALFGGGIVLTAQTFNMSAFHQTGLWIWALGALATAIALPSRPVLIFASLLTAVYAFLEADNALSVGPVWLYLPLMAAGAAAAWRLESKVTMNLLSLSFIVWLGHALYAIDRSDEAALALICAYSLCAGAIALVTARLRGLEITGAGIASAWTLTAAAASLIAAQAAINHAESQAPTLLITGISAAALVICLLAILAQGRAGALGKSAALALACAAVAVCALPWIDLAIGESATLWLELMVGALVFVAAVTLILIGARPGAGLVGGIGVALFAGQSLYIYVELFGDLLNTAAFFFIGGVLLIGLSVGLTRWRKSLASRSEGGPS